MLRKMFGFDHCPKMPAVADVNASIGAQNWIDWATVSGYTMEVTQQGASKYGPVISADGWLAGGLNSNWASNAAVTYSVLYPKAPVSSATKVTFGARARSFSLRSDANELIGFGSTTAGWISPLLFGELVALRASVALSPIEAYIEITIDVVAKTREIYVNGVLAISGAITIATAIVNTVAAGTYGWRVSNSFWNGVMMTHWWRDIYMTDDVVGDGCVNRLGPQTLIPTVVDQVTGPWVSDDGLTDLKTTLNTPQPATPALVSPIDKTPVVLSIAAQVPDGYRVTALQMTLGARSLGDVGSNTIVSVKQNNALAGDKTLVVPRAIAYDQSIGIFTTAPDGSVWTTNKIDTTTITLTPDQ